MERRDAPDPTHGLDALPRPPEAEGPLGAHLNHVEEQLAERAFIFDDPAAYRAGVEEALAAVAARPLHDGDAPSTPSAAEAGP
jgi:hypothetical protein